MCDTLWENGFPPLSSLRLIVPPLQLVSAALLEIVKQGAVMYFGLLAEFITTVLQTAPELLTDTETVQLVIGLRAKAVLELCRSDTFASQQAFQLHLSYITNQNNEASDPVVKASVTNFLRLVHTLENDQYQKEVFYQYIFPTVFGPKYDSALQALMKKFLFNLQVLLPVPDFEQTSMWLNPSQTAMKECVDLMNQPLPLKTLMRHHRHHGHTVPQESSSAGDDCILSSLSYSLGNEDENKCDTVVKTEPISDLQEWQTDHFLSSELKQEEEEEEENFGVLCSNFVKKEEDQEQLCVKDQTEVQGASVEEELACFDKTESSNEEQMDKTGLDSLKTESPTNSGNTNADCSLVCHVCTEVFGSQQSLDFHQRICMTRSEEQDTTDTSCSSSSDAFSEPNPADETFNAQDQMCNNTSTVKQCSICREVFPCSTDLMRHMQCHAQQSSYVCSHCRQDFDSEEDLKTHEEGKCRQTDITESNEKKKNQMLTVVSSKINQIPKRPKVFRAILTCPGCGQRFSYCKRFEEHLKKCPEAASQTEVKTSKKHLVINGCDYFSVRNMSENKAEKSSEKVESLTAAMSSTKDDAGSSQHQTKVFKCTICKNSLSTIVLLQQHYTDSHGITGPYPCTLCKTNFLRLCELVRHQQNKQLFLCPVCKKGFRRPEDLKRHEKVHKPREITNVFTCDTCGRSFRFRVNLVMHQRKHREHPPNVCSLCGKKFSTRDTLKAHMVRHTDGFPCPECGKIFYQKTLLKYHLYRHKGEEPYLCDKCGKGWPNAALLKVHMVKHREDRPFKCDKCGVSYKRESNLIAHHRSKHVGLRPFVCEFCSKAFRVNSELKKHMVVHTGEQPYSCPVCGKKFSRSYSLKKHREKPCQ